jgi:beta-glucuronidase
VNHLVVRVDNRLRRTDLPPRPVSSGHRPRGGWWNYGGIVRDVYLRRVDRIDLGNVQVRPTIACPSCAATVHYELRVRNYSPVPQRVRVQGRYGATPVSIGSATVRAGSSHLFVRDLSIPRPHLWSPGDPYLYPATIDAEAAAGRGRFTPAAGYRLLSGIRNVAVSADGRLTVNWRVVDFRGVAVEEDSLTRGSALTMADRNRIFAWMNRLGANELRTQYPLDPYMYEMADRLGILVWSETPVYRVPGPALKLPSVQRRALAMLRAGIAANGNHPSVFAWSLGNELNQTAPHAQAAYLARAAAAARAADPSRLVAAAIAGIPGSGCGSTYAPLDLIGLNEYYGWYAGLMGDSDQLSPYLGSVRACEPHKAIVVSEFGAEANRQGPPGEKGTYEFQQNFIRTQLGVFASKPWLSGASYFALQDFRVRPQWTGGNPVPQPPWHQKGLVSAAGDAKPAFGAVAQIYRATPEFPSAP